MKKPRKYYTPQEKVAILRRHLIEQVAVSDLCEELQLQPTVPPSGIVVALERQSLRQGPRFSAAPGPSPARAYGHLLYPSLRDLLLPVQRAGRVQPVPGALGDPRGDDRSRRRDHSAAGAGEVSSGLPADHLRQRAAVHCQGFQAVHPALRHDSCEDLPVLSAKQRKDRALAQIAESRMRPSGGAALDRGCAAAGEPLCGPLQHRFACTAPSAT